MTAARNAALLERHTSWIGGTRAPQTKDTTYNLSESEFSGTGDFVDEDISRFLRVRNFDFSNAVTICIIHSF